MQHIIPKKEYSSTMLETQIDEPYVNIHKSEYGLMFDVIDERLTCEYFGETSYLRCSFWCYFTRRVVPLVQRSFWPILMIHASTRSGTQTYKCLQMYIVVLYHSCSWNLVQQLAQSGMTVIKWLEDCLLSLNTTQTKYLCFSK